MNYVVFQFLNSKSELDETYPEVEVCVHSLCHVKWAKSSYGDRLSNSLLECYISGEVTVSFIKILISLAFWLVKGEKRKGFKFFWSDRFPKLTNERQNLVFLYQFLVQLWTKNDKFLDGYMADSIYF